MVGSAAVTQAGITIPTDFRPVSSTPDALKKKRERSAILSSKAGKHLELTGEKNALMTVAVLHSGGEIATVY